MSANPNKKAEITMSNSVIIPLPCGNPREAAESHGGKKARTKARTKQGPQFSAGLLRLEFEHLGRIRTLRRIGNDPANAWEFEFQANGARIRRKLFTSNKDSIARAKELIDAARSGDTTTLNASRLRQDGDESEEPRSEPPRAATTIGAILRVYEYATSLDVSEETQDANGKALRLCLRRALGLPVLPRTATKEEREVDAAEIDAQAATILTKGLAQDYYEHMREECNKLKRAGDQAGANRLVLTWTSNLMQGISVFIPATHRLYEKAGLTLPPTLNDFMAAAKAGKGSMKANYYPPREKTMETTLHEWVKMTDKRMFLTIGLELCFGLRAGEVPQIAWGMFTTERGRPLLDSRRVAMVKGGTAEIVVPPIDPFWRVFVNRIERENWKDKDTEAVVPVTDHEYDELLRGIGAWMRGLGWETAKKSHALRAYVGGLLAMKWDIYRASVWLRHSSVKVTEQAYSYFLKQRKGMYLPEEVLIRFGRKAL